MNTYSILDKDKTSFLGQKVLAFQGAGRDYISSHSSYDFNLNAKINCIVISLTDRKDVTNIHKRIDEVVQKKE